MTNINRFFIAMALAGIGTLSSCFFKNPVTGREELSLVNDATVTSLSAQQYTTFLTTNHPITGPNADLVKKVGAKLATAVQQYLASTGESKLIASYNWEYNLVNSNEVNAWCMPGGKVVVYSGILPVTQNEVGLAVVMGHEIGHAVARHGAERMSEQLVTQYGGAALDELLSTKPAATQQIFNTAYGVGSGLGTLAFSRRQESEADEMGLYFIAMAGYNPNEALTFWKRMAAQGGSKPPAFLSDHPSDEIRIADIQRLIPKAMTYYKH